MAVRSTTPFVPQSVPPCCAPAVVLRRRPDLEVRRTWYLGREQVLVKDPLALKYYRFEPEEYALLEMLDGRSGFEWMQREFARRFAPRTIAVAEIERLCGRLHRDGLILSEAPGQGEALCRRRAERIRRQWDEALANILCLRFPGIDPDRFLTRMDRWFGWLFAPTGIVASCLLAVAAALLVAVNWGRFVERLPDSPTFFGPGNWLWLAAALAVTRLVHELGHGLACKHFGGQCHRLGLMLVVLTPTLYCDVSDAWMLRSRWRRAAVGAAGMYVEVLLASIATGLWWSSRPGLMHYLCLNIMFVGSVGTLVFNLNPLLRYDGYYILSDLIGIPNLRQRADALLKQRLAAWTLGLPEPPASPDFWRGAQWALAGYAVAAAVYRWVVLFAVVGLLIHFLEPYRLQTIGYLIGAVALYGLVVRPGWRLVQGLAVPGRLEQIDKRRLLISSAAVAAAVAGTLCVPLPHSVTCPVRIQVREAAAVYVEIPGILETLHVQPGARVTAGQPLVTLRDAGLALAVAQLENQRREFACRLDGLRRRALVGDPQAAEAMAAARRAIAAFDEQLEQRRRDIARLHVTAPCDGVVLAASRGLRRKSDGARGGGPERTALDRRQIGASLAIGQPVCQIGEPTRLEAFLELDQTQLASLRPGQEAWMMLDHLPSRRYVSRIKEITQSGLAASPSAGRPGPRRAGWFFGAASVMAPPSGRRPATASFAARCPLDDPHGSILLGATGRARVFTGYRTLWSLAHESLGRMAGP